MKFTILQENLAKAVTTASRFASVRAQLPVLGNILISTQKSKVLVASTNLEISVSISVGAKIEREGSLSIPSRVFSELIGNLPKETLNLESEKEQLKISTTGFSSKVLGINPNDFPKIPGNVGKEAVSISQKEFLDAISKVLFSASVDETRPILTGVLFLWSRGELSLVATDGFRLSRKKIKVVGAKTLSPIVLPKLVLLEISRLEEGEEVLFSLQEKEKQVVFGIDSVVLSSRLLEGEYPDFEKIIPKSSTLKVRIDKEDLARAVKLASIFARDASNVVRLKVLKESVKVSAESGQSGSQETEVEAKVEGDSGNFEIAFNFHYLEDFLHSVKGEEVSLEFTSPDKAGVFGDTSDEDFLHLIMPVKIQG